MTPVVRLAPVVAQEAHPALVEGQDVLRVRGDELAHGGPESGDGGAVSADVVSNSNKKRGGGERRSNRWRQGAK
jgi:hypothetical protein